MKWMVVVVVFGAGCIISPVIPIGGNGKSSRELQHDTLSTLLPAQLTAQARWTGEVRVAKLRVWADDEYRAQNLRWEHGFDQELDDANQVMVPMLGVRLAAEYRPWTHHAPGDTLSEHLEALARQDPGDDVPFVVGLTSSLSLVAATFEQIGVANLGGHHVVVRGHADLEERKMFERAFPDLDREEREAALEARRRHKVVAVLLHELSHSLGALHETAPDMVMSPTYSHHAASVGDRNRALMLIELDERLKPAAQRDPRGAAQRKLAALEVEDAGWDATDRAQLIEQLHGEASARAEAAPPGTPIDTPARPATRALKLGTPALDTPATDAPAGGGLAPAARIRYGIPRDGARWKLTADDEPAALAAVRDVLALVNAGKLDAAAKAVAAAEQRWPGLPGLVAERCDIQRQRGAIAAARQLCERAGAQGASSWALYLGGILELRDPSPAATAAGIARLRRAISIDPELGAAWRALGKALDRARATDQLEQLRIDYQARFHASLN
ncbi:MAG TPA: matrixin family metalloprotease [Kofleriaceae bacterium]|nr:matrixin family metalloprotease [Kofleriaceae bacterium]